MGPRRCRSCELDWRVGFGRNSSGKWSGGFGRPLFIPLISGRPAVQPAGLAHASFIFPHQLRQLRNIRCNPSRFVAREQIGSRAPAGVTLEIHIGERLSANTKRSDTQISSRSCSPQKEDPKQKIRTWGRSCCLTLQALWLGGPGVSGGGRGRSPARPCGHHLGTGGADSILDGAVAASHFWATSSQAAAICRRIARSRSVFALSAHPKCSSAF
jgi:hypothetical protein